MEGKMKKIVVWLSTSSRVSWLQVWKQMHVWHSLPISTCWWWEVTSARGREKKVPKEQLLFWGKKGPRLCISKLRSNEFYSTESRRMRIERFGGTHHEILEMHLVLNYNSGKKRTIWRHYPKRRTLWAKSLRAQFWEEILEETSRQADCDSKSSVELGKKVQCGARAIWAQIKWTLWEGPETLQRYWAVTVKVQRNEDAQVFVHDFDLFVTVRLLDGTPAVLLLDMLCSKHRYSFEWKNGKTPRLTTNGKSITCTMDNFVLLAVPGLSSIPAAVCLQHRDQRISEIIPENRDCYQNQSRSEVTSMHARNRCWQILTSRPQDTVNQHTKKFQTECTRRIQRKAFPIGYAHSSEREISEAEGDASKVVTQKWKHSIHTHFRKYRKRSVPRTEEIGDLTTVERKSESRNNNQQFAAVVQDLTTQWILPVWNQNFTGDGEEFYESFQSRHRSQKLFIRTIY